MIIWGISANSHDAAIAVFDYKMRGLSPKLKLELQWASHSERYSGKKNDAHLHPALISEPMTYGSPDNVVWYEKPLNKTLRQLWAGQGWNYNENNIKQINQSRNTFKSGSQRSISQHISRELQPKSNCFFFDGLHDAKHYY